MTMVAAKAGSDEDDDEIICPDTPSPPHKRVRASPPASKRSSVNGQQRQGNVTYNRYLEMSARLSMSGDNDDVIEEDYGDDAFSEDEDGAKILQPELQGRGDEEDLGAKMTAKSFNQGQQQVNQEEEDGKGSPNKVILVSADNDCGDLDTDLDESPFKMRGIRSGMDSQMDNLHGREDSQAVLSQMQCTPVDQGIDRNTTICPSPVTTMKKRRTRAFLTPLSISRRSLLTPRKHQNSRNGDIGVSFRESDVSPRGLVDSQDTDLGSGVGGGDPFVPEMSQDTLALFPPLVQQNGAKGRGGVARASIVATLNSTPAMSNPYENKTSNTGQLRRRRLTGSPVTDSDVADDFEPFSLNGIDLSHSNEHQEKVKSIKRLVVASKEARSIALDFEILAVAGEGSFSVVYKARNRLDGAVYAVKKNKKPMVSNSMQLDSLREVYSLAALQSHMNIVRYYGAWLEGTKGGEHLCIQTEFFEDGNLFKSFVKERKPMPTKELLSVARDVAKALEYMHARGLVHLDIKPDNIFQGIRGFERVYVLGDFGLTCLSDGSEGVKDGDARYIASEALRDYGSQASQQDKKLHLESRDMFSLGATLYELAIGKPSEGSGDEWKWLRNSSGKVIEAKLTSAGLSVSVAGMIVACLAREPSTRPTAEKLVQMARSIIVSGVQKSRAEP